MRSFAQPLRSARPADLPGPDDGRVQPIPMGSRALPAARPEEKRTQSKPFRLSTCDSSRCARFLEIEAIGSILLLFRWLPRNMGRFRQTQNRHAPGFWTSQPDAGAQGLAPLPPHVPGFARRNRPARRPCPRRSSNVLCIQRDEAPPTHQDSERRGPANRRRPTASRNLRGTGFRHALRALTASARAEGCPGSCPRGSPEPYGDPHIAQYRKNEAGISFGLKELVATYSTDQDLSERSGTGLWRGRTGGSRFWGQLNPYSSPGYLEHGGIC
jgi:hypothetical protein